jgi:hypothetical protein
LKQLLFEKTAQIVGNLTVTIHSTCFLLVETSHHQRPWTKEVFANSLRTRPW